MVDENDRQFFRGGPYNGVQPEYFLTWNVGRPHAQAWSGTTTDEAYSLPIVAEVGCLEILLNMVQPFSLQFTSWFPGSSR